MCTLSYYPLSTGSFLLTSNRDESIKRAKASLPQIRDFGFIKVLMPVDGERGGSWLGVNNNGRTACLLNGAFGPHKPRPPYRKSRGLILTDALRYPDLDDFLENYSLQGIEPFTLVLAELNTKMRLIVMRWDGVQRHLETADPAKAHLWSSAMLYPEIVRDASALRYSEMISSGKTGEDDFWQFNVEESYEKKVGRQGLKPYPGLQTRAIASIRIQSGQIQFRYFDTENKTESLTRLKSENH